jgi:hypothetical protein
MDSTLPLLFHGTSSVYLKSIEKHGLGGINVLGELRSYEFLEMLIEIAERNGSVEEYPQLYLCRRIAKQEENPGFSSLGAWQHGDAYLTSCQNRAINYALRSGRRTFGEFLNETNRLLVAINNKCPGLLDADEIQKHLTYNFLTQPPLPIRPMVIVLENIPLEYLAGENNEPINEYIEREGIKKQLADSKDKTKLLDTVHGASFRLTQPIMTEDIKIIFLPEEANSSMEWDWNPVDEYLHKMDVSKWPPPSPERLLDKALAEIEERRSE